TRPHRTANPSLLGERERPFRDQVVDLGLVEAGLGQDVAAVLAEQRRRAWTTRRRPGQVDRAGDDPRASGPRVLDLADHAARPRGPRPRRPARAPGCPGPRAPARPAGPAPPPPQPRPPGPPSARAAACPPPPRSARPAPARAACGRSGSRSAGRRLAPRGRAP